MTCDAVFTGAASQLLQGWSEPGHDDDEQAAGAGAAAGHQPAETAASAAGAAPRGAA